jgi:metal-responsive CopG/Arc/MetJ family transcriptional regulator
MSDHTTPMKRAMRTHVVLPPDLVAEVDRLVGARRRSQFFADAAVEKLARLKLAETAARAAGSLAGIATPHWESSEDAAAWVASSRKTADEERAARRGG